MRESASVELVNRLISQTAEAPWLEFKENIAKPEVVGELISALSNSARLEDRELAYVVWGVRNGSHELVGTTFDPFRAKVGNQSLLPWLRTMLGPACAFDFRVVDHPKGRVVLLEIPAALGVPTTFKRIAYIRIGSTTTPLDDTQTFQKLIHKLRPFVWESGVAQTDVDSDRVIEALDYTSYFKRTKRRLPESRGEILEHLEAEQLVVRKEDDRWDITNLGAILFAHDLSQFSPALVQKSVRVVDYGGLVRTADVLYERDELCGYAVDFEGLIRVIMSRLPMEERIGPAVRDTRTMVPESALREVIANALAHQDLTITGTGPRIDIFENRIEVTNPGESLVSPDRILDLPPLSRNNALVGLMRRMGFCEERGFGMEKIVEAMEDARLRAPQIRSSAGSMTVALFGPDPLSKWTDEEQVATCYYHAVMQHLARQKMKNSTLCDRLGIDRKNAAQISVIIGKTISAGLIKVADPNHPRAGYVPSWVTAVNREPSG